MTDDDGATGTTTRSVTVTAPSTVEIFLNVSARQERTNKYADVTWSGAAGANVDVHRDGAFVTTTPNDGFYTDRPPKTLTTATQGLRSPHDHLLERGHRHLVRPARRTGRTPRRPPLLPGRAARWFHDHHDCEGVHVSSIYYLAASDADATGFVGRVEQMLDADHVLAHDMVTVPHLTSLPDLAEGLAISIDLTVTTALWPPLPHDPETDLSWMAEPVIERVADSLRDRVAAIDPTRLTDLLDAWSEEVQGAIEVDAAEKLATDLILLAGRGRDRGLGLYNWYEL